MIAEVVEEDISTVSRVNDVFIMAQCVQALLHFVRDRARPRTTYGGSAPLPKEVGASAFGARPCVRYPEVHYISRTGTAVHRRHLFWDFADVRVPFNHWFFE